MLKVTLQPATMRTKKIYCDRCDTLLYKYHKDKEGHLLKCYVDRIKEDHTHGDLRCPNCGEQFARKRMIHGRPAHKIIQGKVYMKN